MYFMQQSESQNQIIKIIEKRLYFLISDVPPKNISNAFYFNIDSDLEYQPYYQDFGPLNLAHIYKYIKELNKIMKDDKFKNNIFYHVTSTDYKKCSNAALLMCCYMMLVHHKKAEDAWKLFKDTKFKPFRDASYGNCTYQCTIIDCLQGLQYAMNLGWFDLKLFNAIEYEHYQLVENGDLNWIIPGKFVAFSSPYSAKQDKYGNSLFTPKDYVPIFKKIGVTGVIRLNTVTYERNQFIQNGITHHDLYFHDGTSPSLDIIEQFLKITEDDGVYAVHCKAGLGRTGSLIACYAMKHYCFNAADFIGWIRLSRPGSILGPQQQFLIKIQTQMKKAGLKSAIRKQVELKLGEQQMINQMKKISLKDHKLSQAEMKINIHGDKGQGEKLIAAKAASKA